MIRMLTIDCESFIKKLGFTVPFEEIYDFGDRLGCLHKNMIGGFERHLYIRGALYYSLIRKFKPKTVLEFGTALGYSSLCMAKAMNDFNVDGKIYTIDRFPMNHTHERYFQEKDEKIIAKKKSNNEIWPEVADSRWIEKIIPLTGFTGQVMNKADLPKIEFSLIDAAHHYEGVKHDFYSLLNVAAENFNVLLDDYIDRPYFGITQFVNEEIRDNFETTLIETDTILTTKTKEQKHGIILVESKTAKKPIDEIFPKKNVQAFLKKYRRYETFVTANRHKLNEKLPGLNKIKFKFWKNNL